MCKSFIHVHNHTEYSLLDGANRVGKMVGRAQELGMDALAITDHGVMFGVMEFYFACKEAGIKPLLGMEAYVASQGRHVKARGEEKDSHHLLLLARNLEGYRNLCKLATVAALEGYYYRPRIDHEILREHSAGLLSTTTCLGSEVNQALLARDYAKAQTIAGMYKEIFGADNYFVELQDHGLPEQKAIREPLLRIAKEIGVPVIATNDAHYLCQSDSEAHDVLLCIQTGKLRSDEGRFKFTGDQFYLKSQKEMADIFRDVPEALENTQMVAERCNIDLEKARAPMPEPLLPEGMDSVAYLRHLAEEGLKDRCSDAESKLGRLEYELQVIEGQKFEDYFLLVREFAQATRDRGIYFGVRGSAAGSLVSYCLGITDVDPVDYDLTFERFLNPERISMPDIDMDFEDARRDEIIQYVNDRFGTDRVAQIITFGTLGAKAAIKDCGRVQGYTPQETDKICKTIPTVPGMTLAKAYETVAEFRDMVDSSSRVGELFEIAQSVEGISRHAGVHAAGIVISRDPLVDYVPLYRGNDGQPVTAYEMGILEKIGLLKMDFLGLSNLTVLARTIENIKKTRGLELDVRHLPENDPATFEMLARGDTTGVFQLEGGGMTRWVKQLKPNSVRELAAMIALYRPGPMEHIDRFIATKFGRRPAEYKDERMRPILEETYGVIVYQDQVLKLVQALAGFSLGKADVLRRAMGKKDAGAMAKLQGEFMEGTRANSIADETAEAIWQELLPFAGYAFNKAHAVCYSILAYQTAYLKANYPIEYMAGLLAVYRSKEDRVTAFIEECRRQRIPVLQPDVNASSLDFSIEGGRAIRFGLGAIKGVGDGIVQAILVDREENGPYTHLYGFCERLKPHGLNRTAVEAMIKAGAFDAVERNRQKLLDRVDGALQFADSANRDRLAGQDSLFGGAEEPGAPTYPELPDCDPPGRTQNLAWEKEVMGIYVSDHPLRGHERSLNLAASHRCADLEELEDGATVRLAGVVASIRPILTKKGERMATMVLEDFSGQASVTVFAQTYARVNGTLAKDELVSIIGSVQRRSRPGSTEVLLEVRLDSVTPLVPALDINADRILPGNAVIVTLRRATPKQLDDLTRILGQHPGDREVVVQVEPIDQFAPIFPMKMVEPSPALAASIEKAIGGAKVDLGNLPEPDLEPGGYLLQEHEIAPPLDYRDSDPDLHVVG